MFVRYLIHQFRGSLLVHLECQLLVPQSAQVDLVMPTISLKVRFLLYFDMTVFKFCIEMRKTTGAWIDTAQETVQGAFSTASERTSWPLRAAPIRAPARLKARPPWGLSACLAQVLLRLGALGRYPHTILGLARRAIYRGRLGGERSSQFPYKDPRMIH